MNDYTVLIIFFSVAFYCFYISLKMSKETKILTDLHAKKFGTESFNKMRDNMLNNPIAAPYYALRKSLSMLPIIFKKTNDLEINIHAQRVRKYFYSMILLVIALFLFLVIYGFLSTR